MIKIKNENSKRKLNYLVKPYFTEYLSHITYIFYILVELTNLVRGHPSTTN